MAKVKLLNSPEWTCVSQGPDQSMWCTRLDRDKGRHTTMNVDTINTDNSTALHATRMAARASGAVTDMADKPADSIPTDNQRPIGVGNGPTAIQHIYPHALFNKFPLELRRIGALGGKACARNQRARRALMPTPPPAIPLGSVPRQSTAEAVAALDAPVSLVMLCGKASHPETAANLVEVRGVPDRQIKPTSRHVVQGRPVPRKARSRFHSFECWL
jgi:hypothetical protein